MHIRHLRRQEDVRGIKRVNEQAWHRAYADLLPEAVIHEVASEPSEERVETAFEQLQEHKDRFLIAEDDKGNIRGYAYLRWGDDETKEFVGQNEAGLKEIYVEPEVWGEGIGTALLEQGLELLPETIVALKLEMLSGNQVGERFYRARGFEKTGKSEVEIGETTCQTDIYTLTL